MTEKELQIIYDSIMNEDLKKANDLIDSHYLSRNQILTYLKNFIKTKSIQEQQQFKEKYKLFCTSLFEYFKVVMSLIEELEQTGSINFDKYTTLSTIREYLKRFRKNFPDYNHQIDMIRQEIIRYERRTKEKNLITDFFYNEVVAMTVYEMEFRLIATSENPVLEFKKLGWDEKTFTRKLNLFKKKYPAGLDDGLAEKFEKWFKLYLKEITKEQIKVDFEYRKDNLSLAEHVIEDLITSGKSIYEYCDMHLEHDVQEIIKYIRLVYGEKANELISKINKNEDSFFQQKIDFIAVQIMEDSSFTIIDYYLSTKLSLEDFYKRTAFKVSQVGNFIDKNSSKTYYRKGVPVIKFTKEKEMKVTRIIMGKLITEEDKLAIFKFLEENQIPVNQYTYRTCLNKFASNDIDFVQKINTYKGSF